MKKFKFPSLLLGLAFAVMCAFAFTPHPVIKTGKFTTQYYYNGPDQTIANLKVATNWTLVDPGCSSGLGVCGLQGSSTRSVFNASLLTYSTQPQMLAASNIQKP